MELRNVLLILFAVISVIHLVSLLYGKEIVRAISKSLLMPSLLAVYVFNAQDILWPVIAALIFGCAGDIFLLDIKNLLRFRLGLASFLIGHIFYIIAFIGFARPLNIPALAVSIAAAVALGIFVYKFIHPKSDMKIPVVVYQTVILVMVILALQVFLNNDSSFGMPVFAGSLCFIISDSILARFTFVRKPKYGQFAVMLTYIAAQFLIIMGFCRIFV